MIDSTVHTNQIVPIAARSYTCHKQCPLRVRSADPPALRSLG